MYFKGSSRCKYRMMQASRERSCGLIENESVEIIKSRDGQSPIVNRSPTGSVSFVRSEDLLKSAKQKRFGAFSPLAGI